MARKIDEIFEALDNETTIMTSRSGRVVRLKLEGFISGFKPGDMVSYKYWFNPKKEFLLVGISGEDGNIDSKPSCMWILEKNNVGIGYLTSETLANKVKGVAVRLIKKAETSATPKTMKEAIERFLNQRT